MNPPYKLLYKGKTLGYYNGLWVKDTGSLLNYLICSIQGVIVGVEQGADIDNEVIQRGIRQIKGV